MTRPQDQMVSLPSLIRKNWEFNKEDVTNAVQNFFSTGRILKQITPTFLVLIPKSNEASSLSDYRSIARCNVIYKIISKILSNRLKRVVGELVSPNKHALLERRQISECSLLAYELISDFNKYLLAQRYTLRF